MKWLALVASLEWLLSGWPTLLLWLAVGAVSGVLAFAMQCVAVLLRDWRRRR